MRTSTLSRGRLITDIVLAGVFALFCLPFALLGNWADALALVGFSAALAVRRLSPPWSLGVAWGAALLQMLALRELQVRAHRRLEVGEHLAVHGRAHARLETRETLVVWDHVGSCGTGRGERTNNEYTQGAFPGCGRARWWPSSTRPGR